MIILILGPTAVGKTAVALKLAERLPCEIVSCDSMQVYREISIATSKPSFVEQRSIPHHLLDVVSVEDKFDVAMYNRLAGASIEKILAQRKYPLVVGGSGMYAQILLDGIFVAGERDLLLRKELESLNVQELYAKLKEVDPQAASKIHAHDLRRIVRALEVYETTKTPISVLQKQRHGLADKYPVMVFGLDRDREELYRRINQRVDRMFADGLIEEIRAIRERKLSLTARRIIGVAEVLAYLRGERDLPATQELMKMNTRRLAKRQLTWFRKDKRIAWFLLKDNDTDQNISEQILKEIDR